jgi:hypothetical protein
MRLQIVNFKRYAPAVYILLGFATHVMAGPASLNLVCSGNSYKQDGPFPTFETFSLKIDGSKTVMIGGPGSQQPVKASVVADNGVDHRPRAGLRPWRSRNAHGVQ